MSANSKSVRNAILKGMVGLAGTAGIVPAAAVAQDCKLTVQAVPQVLYTGQSTRIHVYACPSDPKAPDAPYAFASAAFDVLANDMYWSFATDGKIVDSDVLDIEVGQDHQPELGIYADPSNPYRVWGGILKASDEPALVEVEVDPAAFSVYPSKLTSSSVECDAEGGSDLVFVNPLSVGSWLAAPGPGTAIEIQDDVIIDGRIITGENPASIRVGMLHPAIQKVRESSTRVAFDGEPVTFTATVQVLGAGDDVFQWDPGDGSDPVRPDARRSLIGNMTVTFDGLENGGHVAGANFAMMDGSVRFVAFEGFLGGVSVASGDLDDGGNNQIPALVVDALPPTIGAKVGSRLLTLQGDGTYGDSTSTGDYGIWQRSFGTTLRYDQPVVAVVRGANGQPQTVTLDRIEVQGSQRNDHWRESTFGDEVFQPYLGIHVFEAEGLKEMWVAPSQVE